MILRDQDKTRTSGSRWTSGSVPVAGGTAIATNVASYTLQTTAPSSAIPPRDTPTSSSRSPRPRFKKAIGSCRLPAALSAPIRASLYTSYAVPVDPRIVPLTESDTAPVASRTVLRRANQVPSRHLVLRLKPSILLACQMPGRRRSGLRLAQRVFPRPSTNDQPPFLPSLAGGKIDPLSLQSQSKMRLAAWPRSKACPVQVTCLTDA